MDIKILMEGIEETLRTMDADVSTHISVKPRGYRNCISPSMLKLKADYKKQARHFFDPDVMLELGIVEEAHYGTLKRNTQFDTNGCFYVCLGTLVHEMILPQLEKLLHSKGYGGFMVEHPVFSTKYGIFGTADMLHISDDKVIDIYDLKTTGVKILDREDGIPEDYKRQLYAYMLCIEEMFPDHTIGTIGVVSISRVPGSKIDGKTLPLLAYCEVNPNEVRRVYGTFIKNVYNEVIAINTKLKDAGKDYAEWVLEKYIPDVFHRDIERVYSRLEGLK